MPRLFASQSVLRDACIYGALTFAVFNGFWATLTFYLESPLFGLDSRTIGLFSLVAIAGALTANLAGRLTAQIHPTSIIAVALVITLLSFAAYLGAGKTVAGLVVGIILMDLGIQATHIGNQTLVHGLMPAARNRLHCIYMVAYFMGGSGGSAIGTWSYAHWGWPGMCAAGTGLTALALAYWTWRRFAGRYESSREIRSTGL
jgi:predicted MFS family arabinose efflux permease